MKKITSLFLCVLMLVSMLAVPVSASGSEDSGITVYVDGCRVKFDTQPITENGRTLVPVRAIFEALGANVYWDSENQIVTATKVYTTISLQIGSTQMYVNGNVKTLDVPAKLIDSRTLVPARAVTEALGGQVDWYEEMKQVLITSAEKCNEYLFIYADTDFGSNAEFVDLGGLAVGYTTDGKYSYLETKVEKQEGDKIKTEQESKTICDESGNPRKYKIANDFYKKDNVYYAAAQKDDDVWYLITYDYDKKTFAESPFSESYTTIYNFHDGLACALKGENQWVYIDTNGEELSLENGLKVIDIFDFSNGFARVQKSDSNFGYINIKGEYVFDAYEKKENRFVDGIAIVQKDRLYGYVKDGKVIGTIGYKEANAFDNGFAKVVDANENSYYINKNGEHSFDAYLDDVDGVRFVEKVEKDKKYGYIKADNTIELIYTSEPKFNNGFARVTKSDEKTVYIKVDGGEVKEAYTVIHDLMYGYDLVQTSDKKYGFVKDGILQNEGALYSDYDYKAYENFGWVYDNQQWRYWKIISEDVMQFMYSAEDYDKENYIAIIKTDDDMYQYVIDGELKDKKFNKAEMFDKHGFAKVSLDNETYYISKDSLSKVFADYVKNEDGDIDAEDIKRVKIRSDANTIVFVTNGKIIQEDGKFAYLDAEAFKDGKAKVTRSADGGIKEYSVKVSDDGKKLEEVPETEENQ